MMATIPYDELLQLVKLPRENVVRTVPLPGAAKRSGPILAYPENAFVKDLLTQIGTPVMVAEESEITTLVSEPGAQSLALERADLLQWSYGLIFVLLSIVLRRPE